MDKEQARFVLRSFRPDGADAGDADFAEALKLALGDRELGEWLAHERAFDASFAQALGAVDLPANLREDILACLAVERGDFPQAEDSADAAWIGALASIQPPAGLRDEVLAAMDRTVEKIVRPKLSPLRRFAIPMAAAAGIALAVMVTRQENQSTQVIAQSGRIPLEAVQAGFVKTIESPQFALEEKNSQHGILVSHLRSEKLPCPGWMPPGLENAAGLGCRELVIDGKRGSLICFNRGEDGLVHMIIFFSKDLEGIFPDSAHPEITRNGDWSSACWQLDGKVYVLMGQTPVKKISGLF
jgi:hypothetical protein